MKLVVHRRIAVRPDELFALSQDYGRRLEWDSFLQEAYLLHGAVQAAVGVESYCKSKGGSVMVSQYVSYRPPHVAAVTMTRGPALLHSFSGTWEFRAAPDGGTDVRFVYNFRLRPAWLRPLLEPLVARIYGSQMRRRLAAFQRWSEGGAMPVRGQG
ncbi:type II toxin-antitoxin system RatA family toxin [Dyella terrae]|uniref:type II toxin-antitoxin system RatA family toxin n=1 Tax=Dyella terrae TaxID=522259 RepID=UPI001EFED18F|nr:SRPBCC family protein [Dyella terrae]ULU27486.1 SRPBCC family protein [Dyella terrae]